jgi:hypothetical protein
MGQKGSEKRGQECRKMENDGYRHVQQLPHKLKSANGVDGGWE